MVKHILIGHRNKYWRQFRENEKKLRTKLSCVLQVKCQLKHIINKKNFFINFEFQDFEFSIFYKIIISHLSLVSG